MNGQRRAPRAGSPAPTRKERSLGTLCSKFLRIYGGLAVGAAISLDESAVVLGVERRRLYDITNILEALDVLERSNKSRCTPVAYRSISATPRVCRLHSSIPWHAHICALSTRQPVLAKPVAAIHIDVLQSSVPRFSCCARHTTAAVHLATVPVFSQHLYPHQSSPSRGVLKSAAGLARRYAWQGLGRMGGALARLRDLPAAHAAYGPELAERRERSLQHTAERFVQLFLLAPPPRILTLEQAAAALIGAP